METINIIFYIVVFLGVAVSITAIAIFINDRNEHKESSSYIQDRRNGEIHHKDCIRIKKIPVSRRRYLDDFEYKHLKHITPTMLKYCRLCSLNKKFD